MALPTFVTDLTAVPETLHEHYSRVDDSDEAAGFALSLDGKGDKSRVAEFRKNNINLDKRAQTAEQTVAELQAKYGKVDLARVAAGEELLKKAHGDKERKMLEVGDLEGLMAMRTTNMVQDYDEKEAALKKAITEHEAKYSTLLGQHGRMQIGQQVQAAIAKAGVKPRQHAMDDILARTHNIFSVDTETGGLVARNADGSLTMSPKGEPITMADHVSGLGASAPHLFETSGGGGAAGSNTSKIPSGVRRILKSDALGIGRYAHEIREGKAVVVDG